MLCPAILFPHIAYFRIYCLCLGFSLLFHRNHSYCQAVTICSRAQAAILRSSGNSVKEIAKLFKTERWVNKWPKRKSFEDKPWSGRPSVLTNYARNVTSSKVWILTNKGWKALKRKKMPLSSEKQRRPRLKFARKYSKLAAEARIGGGDFLFADECCKYLGHYPNPENHIVWGSQECDVPPAYQVKQSAKVMVWRGMTGRGLTKLLTLPSGQTLPSKY